MQNNSRQPSGMRAYLIIQAGQFFSIIGTGMTRFALTLFAWEQTQEATTLALMGFFGFLSVILFSPIAGALVDRSNRKLAMMLSDLGAGSMSIFILVMLSLNQLQIWHLYVAFFVAGAFESFQFPAYSSAISMMLDKKDYARSMAISGLVEAGSGIIAPILAGVLFAFIGLRGILIIDIFTFSFAIGALLIVHIPQPPPTDPAKQNSLLEDSLFGFRYIWARPSLFGVQMIFFFGNLLFSLAISLQSPMILARTNSNEQILGLVNALIAVGGLIGGLYLTWWGGPKKKVRMLAITWILSAIFGMMLMGAGQVWVWWAFGGFVTALVSPTLNGSNQSLWMSKVPPPLQGRVFSIRRLLAQVVGPLGMFIAGPLADRVFEPAMRADGALAPIFGGIFGVGAGAGMGLLITIAGVLCVITTSLIYFVPVVRHVETLIPDFETDLQEAPAT